VLTEVAEAPVVSPPPTPAAPPAVALLREDAKRALPRDRQALRRRGEADQRESEARDSKAQDAAARDRGTGTRGGHAASLSRIRASAACAARMGVALEQRPIAGNRYAVLRIGHKLL
jgi:hypothetical protein